MPKNRKHTVTQEDLDNNPGLAEHVKVDDVIELGPDGNFVLPGAQDEQGGKGTDTAGAAAAEEPKQEPAPVAQSTGFESAFTGGAPLPKDHYINQVQGKTE